MSVTTRSRSKRTEENPVSEETQSALILRAEKTTEENTVSEEIQAALLLRAEKNRQKALLLKKSKVIAHPYTKSDNQDGIQGRHVKTQGHRVIDSGGGFLIEEDEELEREMMKIASTPAPIISELPTCEECNAEYKDSYLLQTFDLSVCDKCRDSQDKHSLITRTEAKQEYLLKDCDLDKREPHLKFILKKNPHNVRWGEMKLYLHLQIEKRALEVWGTEEKLLEERELRDVKKETAKIKKFNKKVKQLRMTVRSSLYDKTNKASHVHQFGEDTYNEDEDNYTHVCEECGYEEVYEKM